MEEIQQIKTGLSERDRKSPQPEEKVKRQDRYFGAWWHQWLQGLQVK